jgi:acetyl esterase
VVLARKRSHHWVLGNADTHDRLVRELAVGTGAAVVFVEYDPSPEARYPVALEQGYATAQWIGREGAANQLDPDRIAIAGDSVGGNMTTALALMASERGGRALRAPVDVLPGHRRRDGHRVLRAVRLADLPPALVIVDEADVLRDEGEAYAARLRAAGVAVTTVRYDGITHDFMMLNPLSSTHATRAAVAQAISILRHALDSA